MTLVDDQQRILRQVVEQARRRLAGAATGQVARVVLDAGAIADLHHHLEIERRALLEPLCLEQLAVGAQLARVARAARRGSARRRDRAARAASRSGSTETPSGAAPCAAPRRSADRTTRATSISSSNSSTRTASRSDSAGKMSMTSPRTRYVPCDRSSSLRVYCMSASRRSKLALLDPVAAIEVQHHR